MECSLFTTYTELYHFLGSWEPKLFMAATDKGRKRQNVVSGRIRLDLGKTEAGEARAGTGTDEPVRRAGLKSSQEPPERLGEAGKGWRAVGWGWLELERTENSNTTYEGMRARFLTSDK